MFIYLPIAGVAVNALVVLGAGGAVGVLSGMFGVGGGFLITPLMIFLGIPPPVAIATGANQAAATAISGAVAQWYRGNIDVKIGLVLMASGVAGSVIGIGVVALLRRSGQLDLAVSLAYIVLLGTVGSLMLIESLAAMRKAAGGANVAGRRARQHTWVHGLPLKMRFPHSRLYISIIPVTAIGLLVGLMTGVMGVGGGFILVPAMVYVLKMPTALAIGTSLFQIVFVGSFTTLMQAVTMKSVDIVLAGLLIVSGVIGTQLGTLVGARLRAEQLRALLALLVLMVCVRVGLDLTSHPADLYSLAAPSP